MIIPIIMRLQTLSIEQCLSFMPEIAIYQSAQPIEQINALPHKLSGETGSNRNYDGCQIAAYDDLQAIHCWLNEFEDSPQTYRNYRKEVERLLMWSLTVKQKPLSSLVREDFVDFQKFLSDPQPHDYWCGPRAPRTSVKWKPFEKPLKDSSKRQAMIIINAFYSYLVEARYLSGNPLSLIRRRKHKLGNSEDSVVLERYLDHETWAYIKQHISELPHNTQAETNYAERVRFLFHFLYLLAPRVSEVSSHQMNSFRLYRGKWWWFALGKGNKKAKVPVSDEMLDALIRYRQHLKLSALPAAEETFPVIASIKGKRSITASSIYRIVKKVVIDTSNSIESGDPSRAAILRQASTHWFRHTSISHQDDSGIGLKYLKKNARHEKLETTSIYQHAEDDAWHSEAGKHQF